MTKFLIAFTAIFIAAFAHASSVDESRTRFSCSFDGGSRYELEVAIDDIGDEEGTITVLASNDKKVVRREKAYFRDGLFAFGSNETVSIGTYSLDAFTAIYGIVTMKNLNGRIHCQEIAY